MLQIKPVTRITQWDTSCFESKIEKKHLGWAGKSNEIKIRTHKMESCLHTPSWFLLVEVTVSMIS